MTSPWTELTIPLESTTLVVRVPTSELVGAAPDADASPYPTGEVPASSALSAAQLLHRLHAPSGTHVVATSHARPSSARGSLPPELPLRRRRTELGRANSLALREATEPHPHAA